MVPASLGMSPPAGSFPGHFSGQIWGGFGKMQPGPCREGRYWGWRGRKSVL